MSILYLMKHDVLTVHSCMGQPVFFNMHNNDMTALQVVQLF